MSAQTTKDKYFEAVGRRKTSTARVRLHPAGKTEFSINDKTLNDYFDTEGLTKKINDPFNDLGQKFKVTVKVVGGGINSQAEAVRHGISRALVKFDDQLRNKLKKSGFLKRDPRSKERRKAGLAQAARKRKQWSKR